MMRGLSNWWEGTTTDGISVRTLLAARDVGPVFAT